MLHTPDAPLTDGRPGLGGQSVVAVYLSAYSTLYGLLLLA